MIFTYKSNSKDTVNVYSLRGELISKDQAAPLLEEVDTAISKNSTKILLNLSDLKYMNSSGLNVIINILTRARKAGGDLAICCVNKKINELLVITKLNSVFNVCDDEEKAVKLLSQ
ncbi:MAG: STAS domain-containing protein [Bacteroidetes bacterium]|nr:STAS domain-containing protein [Bacteroidota bacterium]